uniref:Uncharacterized protein n=1 Tax=Oryza barthii TaxID=65489 RepID=A0A0D3GZG1_9ORYZ
MPTLKRLHETYLDFYQDHTENFQQYLYLLAPLCRNHTIAAMSVRRGAKVTAAPVPVRREGRLALAARSTTTAGPIASGWRGRWWGEGEGENRAQLPALTRMAAIRWGRNGGALVPWEEMGRVGEDRVWGWDGRG